MNKEELININGIREDLYQAMQIGDITLNSKHSQELYDFMNYQDKEIERINNIISELEKYLIKIRETSTPQERIMAKFVLEYIKILKGEELDDVRPYDELDEILELERDNLELKGVDEE